MNLTNSLERAENIASETTQRGQALAKEGFRELSSRALRVLEKVDALGIDTLLGYVGLTRRSTLLSSVGTFGAGVAVGAGLGVLFAPASGAATRRRIARVVGRRLSVLDAAKDAVEEPVEKVKDAARDLGSKVEKTAEEVKDRVGEIARPNHAERTRAHRPS